MKEDNVLQVYYEEKLVGTLALTARSQKRHFNIHRNGWKVVFLSVPKNLL